VAGKWAKGKEKEEVFERLDEYFPFVKAFTEEEMAELKENLSIRKYKRGEQIHQGEEGCTGVMAICKGRTRTYIFSSKGKEITLFRLLPQDTCILSASCMMNNIVFDIQVAAEEDSLLVVITPEYFEELARRHPSVEKFRNDIISMRFSEVMWLVEQILFRRMDQRIAAFLIEMAIITESDVLTLSHQEIADNLGTAREVVSRILKYLENDELVEISRKEIKILNLPGLEEMVEN